MSYDPNDPARSNPAETPPADPAGDPTGAPRPYVAPVERPSSSLPLIIGVLLALAVAYFVVQYFLNKDVAAGDDPAVVTAPETAVPDATPPAVVIEEAPATTGETVGGAASDAAERAADETHEAVDAIRDDQPQDAPSVTQ